MMSFRLLLKIALRLAIIALAILGAITIALWLLSHRRPPSPDNVSYKLSPNHVFKAAHVIYAGGGGPAGFCYGYITVVPADASDAAASDEKNAVFSYADCNVVGAYAGPTEWSPMVEWLSDSDVKITFAIGPRHLPRQLGMGSSDPLGKVHVTFEVRKR